MAAVGQSIRYPQWGCLTSDGEMGIFVQHEPCPNCGSRDNLARYDDGSAFCFGRCGYSEGAGRIPIQRIKETEDDLQVPPDLCNDFPRHVVEWLGKYGMGVVDAYTFGWKYSPSRDQLVFLFMNEDGHVECYQARNFASGAKSKYYNRGNTDTLFPLLAGPLGHGKLVVLVEDVVSAAKASRRFDAMPLLGSSISLKKLSVLRVFGYEELVFWLDYDKWTTAVKLANSAKLLGFQTTVVKTPLDPKEYTAEDIQTWVLGANNAC